MLKISYLIIYILIFLVSCDEGLVPPDYIPPSFISGKIYYTSGISSWPPADSVKDIRLLLFKKYPPGDIITEVTSGEAIISPSLEKFVDSTSYSVEIARPPVEYKYIVVAQNYGAILEWRAIGVYNLSGDHSKPSPVSVIRGKSLTGINIFVDFNNLPPQPF